MHLASNVLKPLLQRLQLYCFYLPESDFPSMAWWIKLLSLQEKLQQDDLMCLEDDLDSKPALDNTSLSKELMQMLYEAFSYYLVKTGRSSLPEQEFVPACVMFLQQLGLCVKQDADLIQQLIQLMQEARQLECYNSRLFCQPTYRQLEHLSRPWPTNVLPYAQALHWQLTALIAEMLSQAAHLKADAVQLPAEKKLVALDAYLRPLQSFTVVATQLCRQLMNPLQLSDSARDNENYTVIAQSIEQIQDALDSRAETQAYSGKIGQLNEMLQNTITDYLMAIEQIPDKLALSGEWSR